MIGDQKDPRINESNVLLKQYTSKAVEQTRKGNAFSVDETINNIPIVVNNNNVNNNNNVKSKRR